MASSRLMTCEEALALIEIGSAVVIESRKYGIVANWYTTRDKAGFAEWLRGRVAEGAYPEDEYGITWCAWSVPPTDFERRSEPWGQATRRV